MLKGKSNNFFRNIVKYNNRFLKNDFVAEQVRKQEEEDLKMKQQKKNVGYTWINKFGRK